MAAFPSEAAREDLLRHLPAGARFARPGKWHVTLAFLGDVPDGTREVADALATVPPAAPFPLRLTGGGRFGEVTWAGLSGDRAALTALRESIRTVLDDAGFPIDARPFRPHLTVSYRAEPALLPALAGYRGPEWSVTAFALVESLLGNYHTRQEWALHG
ncbi:RNA 2',3'-cyclic phosphodiesterase [Actinoplanes sp. L3-i22]|uniref:RNA 2',3'-cyclic phosphodiesterase n=1 Tax=Actinoplanes sp. L3-i22 TaxID=2836373 RepID=UPI001C74B2BA|nr:RNA 2',3'-cyclic phosphodiesterase [Actinoplanes sp. L3-i22]BCY05251.1 RNA 2',3'-cyclic phosphodiesterase [Actinoplanes sp. L3-i22]